MHRTAFRNIKVALAIAIAIFCATAVGISAAIVQRQQALSQAAHYNITWAASQALAELQQLQYRVAAFGFAGSPVGKDEVLLRLDILFNRLQVLRGSELAAFTDAQPEQKALVDGFAATLQELQLLIESIEEPGRIQQILSRVTPLVPQLTRFAAAAKQFSAQQVAQDQRRLLSLHWVFSAIATGLVLCGIGFIGLLFFQNRVVRQAHEELRRMADDLRMAKNVAESTSEAKSRFLANMSHELRTPLNAIIGFSDIIAQETFGAIGQPRYREYAADVLKSGQHMLHLVNDVLTMARLEAGHVELTFQSVDLRKVVEATVCIFRGAEIAKCRDIIILPDGHWPQMLVDERAVRQMVLNLLSNAAKFSPPETPIQIAYEWTAEADLQLTVSDRGIGMTAEEAEIAVRPFHQVDARLARKYEGAGLGLSIVKALAEKHGGRLVIASKPGIGSEIGMIFPRKLVQLDILGQAA
jgi:two-component system, cell cycle sensor histidine kinase PleC